MGSLRGAWAGGGKRRRGSRFWAPGLPGKPTSRLCLKLAVRGDTEPSRGLAWAVEPGQC